MKPIIPIPTTDSPANATLVIPAAGGAPQAHRAGNRVFAWLPHTTITITTLTWFDPVTGNYNTSHYDTFKRAGGICSHTYGGTVIAPTDIEGWSRASGVPFEMTIPSNAVETTTGWEIESSVEHVAVSPDADRFWYPDDDPDYCYYLTDELWVREPWRRVTDVQWSVTRRVHVIWAVYEIEMQTDTDDELCSAAIIVIGLLYAVLGLLLLIASGGGRIEELWETKPISLKNC